MKVLLVSLNAKYIHSSLALRLIKDYCKPLDEHIKILELTINHQEQDIVKAIYKEQPDVIGLSCYIWNMSMIEHIVPILKKVLPHTEIILGGPEVSYNSEALFEELEIDKIFENEGEATWREYIEWLIDGKGRLENIAGMIYRNSEGNVRRTLPREPMDLATLPFVYDDLSGLEHKIIYYEASRGCPFNCQYCLSSVEKGVRFMPLERVLDEIQYFLDQKVKQIKFVDRTFNTRKDFAQVIWQYIIEKDNGYTNFHFEIAAELLTDECLEVLKAARPGLIQFEIGVQSTNLEVLKAIKRIMPFEEIKSISSKIKTLGNIHQHLDLIAGLPFEGYQSFRNSFNDVISIEPEQFQLGFLKLLKGSGLRERAEEYGIVFNPIAPYEVLYTHDLSYGELLKLHDIEDLVERYYNTNRFVRSLRYMYSLFDSPFDFYEQLALYWEKAGYHHAPVKKEAYYKILVDFAETLNKGDLTLLKELVRFDWLSHEMIKEVPESLLTLNQSVYNEAANTLIRNDDLMINYYHINPLFTSRQRLRKMHIEWFSYNVLGNNTLLENPMPILFNYLDMSARASYQVIEIPEEL